MLISGVWHLCDDGIVRPVIRGEVRGADGSWVQTPFLLDTAADRTVLSADILTALGLPPTSRDQELNGVGGLVPSVIVATKIQLPREDGGQAGFTGQFAAFTQPEALDMSVLGRDITNLFAVIVDRPRDFVAMLGQDHYYAVGKR